MYVTVLGKGAEVAAGFYARFGRMARVVFGSGMASVFLLASNIILARVLAPASYGDYMTAFTLCNGGMFLATFGLPQLLLQEHGRRGIFSADFSRAAILIQAIAAALSSFVVVSAVFLLNFSDTARMMTVLLVPVLVAQATGDVASVYFQLKGSAWLTGGWLSVLNGFRLAAVLAFLGFHEPLSGLPLNQSVAAIAFAVISLKVVRKMYREFSSGRAGGASLLSSSRAVLLSSFPYAVSNIMFYAVSQLPLVLIALVSGSRTTALYGVSFLILQTFYFVPQTLMIRLLMLKYHQAAVQYPQRLLHYYRRGTFYAAIAGAALAVPAFFLLPPLVNHVFGSKYSDAIALAQIMLVCVPIRFMTVNVAAVVVSGVSIWHKNGADLLGGLFAVLAYWILAKNNPHDGPAVAAIASELVVLAAHVWLVHRYLFNVPLALRER